MVATLVSLFWSEVTAGSSSVRAGITQSIFCYLKKSQYKKST
jgi:hypothetical protein